ncbi:MAG: methyl-accepting chemotaxis protein [Nitrosomonadales bacterium]|nr:methyl-accepting chemotaxis protein [Nitrosomonadales bacterium]
MKINTPVTNNEVFMQPGRPIVSKTDLKGIITYANQTFIDISGYSREELIGKNHNIVRHPDMPAGAFAWLWDTIQQDLPWRGIVKNRCKNGDFYWVEAYATPIKENGRTVGYMSVRNIPDRAEVKACDALYKEIREGRAGLPKRGFRLDDVSFQTKLNVIFITMAVMLGGSNLYYFLEAKTTLEQIVASVAGVGTLLTIVARVWLGGTVNRFLGKARYALTQIAEGNFKFTVSVDSRDEFGHILNELESMRINLRAIIADVMLAAKNVEAGSQNVETEMQGVLQRSNSQAERVMGASTAVEQMHSSIETASDHTKTSEQMANVTMDIVRDGSQKMDHSIASVERIVSVVNESRATILNLHESIQRIEQLTQTIKDVAEQTNLLALNAAIEAARAGEQGRGFAVVADEVRKLAERTARSTVDISSTVNGIQQATEAAVSSMDNAVTEVGRSTTLIQESSASLADILDATNKEMEMAHEISMMLQQQTVAAEDVARNMSDIQMLATSNTDSIRSTESTTEQLTHTATELSLLVKHFEKSL